jgi:intracellular sulfur oxidation DsrE/DsrF family protein
VKPVKTLFHLNSSEASKKSELLANIKNLQKDSRIEVEEIQVVINSDAVEMAEKGSASEEYIKEYLEEGVKFNICRNSVDNREKIEREELIEGLEVVESGIGTINLFQEKGYNYTKI